MTVYEEIATHPFQLTCCSIDLKSRSDLQVYCARSGGTGLASNSQSAVHTGMVSYIASLYRHLPGVAALRYQY